MADRLTIIPRERLGVASVMARKGVAAEAIGVALGVAMRRGPHATFAGPRTVLGIGPGAWLVLADDSDPDFADRLAETLAGLASVSDQSGAWVVQRLSGPGARTLLQRGIAIDLHPDVFHTGSVATTAIAHIGVILWQIEDSQSYDIATSRSYAKSFDQILVTAVAAL